MKRIFLLLVAFLAMLSASAGYGRDHITLDSRLRHGGNQAWYMIRDGETTATGREISMPGFKPEGWAEAIVPATVLTNLVEQKIYPEPYFGQTNKLSNKYEGKNTVTGPCTAGFEALAALPEAKPTVTVRRLPNENGVGHWEVTVKNGSRRIAFFCQLLFTDAKGKAVHGTFYSDNFFSLLPGEKKTVTVRSPLRGQEYRIRFSENMGKPQFLTPKSQIVKS